jgi:hypothetical protein
VVDAHHVQDRRVQVVEMEGALDDREAQLVCLAERETRLDAAAAFHIVNARG